MYIIYQYALSSISPLSRLVSQFLACLRHVFLFTLLSSIWTSQPQTGAPLSLAPLINCPLTKTENQMRDKGKRREKTWGVGC